MIVGVVRALEARIKLIIRGPGWNGTLERLQIDDRSTQRWQSYSQTAPLAGCHSLAHLQTTENLLYQLGAGG
jgi:hypothetical protein